MTEGKKFDNGKTPYELIDWKAIEELAEILQFGANKYGPNNWQQLDNAPDRYFSATMRHLLAYRSGESVDPETGRSHLAHLLCNVMFLRHFERKQ